MISRVFSPVSLLLWLVIGGVAAVAGPFGTFQALSLPQRVVYWGVFVALSILLGRGGRVALEAFLPDSSPGLRDAVLVAAIVPAMTLLIVILAPILPGGAALPEPSAWRVAGYVLAICVIVLGFQRAVRITPAAGDLPGLARPRLADRLPDDMQGPFLRLSAMDHHVEVVTVSGSVSLRMRLADAIREMEPVEGYCTHRSHWVTRPAIDRVEREGAAKLWIVLTNGDRVPVSRKYRPDLEAAGILDAEGCG